MTDVTAILNAIEAGNARTEELLPLVYEELRRLALAKMRHERPGHTLQATALVHVAFLRLLGDEQATWQNRRRFRTRERGGPLLDGALALLPVLAVRASTASGSLSIIDIGDPRNRSA